MIGLLYSAVRNVDVHNFQRFHEEQLEAIERMTSGKAINRASDDVASMGHLTKMKAEALGTNQSIRNSNDAYSYAEVGDTALANCEEALHRMKELAIQAMDGANTGQDIEAIEKEFDHWKEIFAQVIENTEFAGDKILNDKSKWFQTNWKPTEITTFDPVYLASNQVGSNKMISNGTISDASAVNAAANADYSTRNNGITTSDSFTLKGTFGNADIKVSAKQTAYAIANLVNQHTQTTGVRAEAKTYAKLHTLNSAGDVLFNLHGRSSAQISAKIEDTSDLGSLISKINEQSYITGITAELTDNRSAIILCNDEGYDIGIENFEHSTNGETIKLTGLESDGVTVSGGDTLLTDGPLADDSALVGGHLILKSPKDFTLSTTSGTALYSSATMISSFVDLESASVDTFDNAIEALDAVDGTLNQVVDTRSRFGQVMQRLEHNASGLQNSLAALEQSRSRREDTDFAAEMVKNFRAQYMTRTNLSVSTVANKMSQTALQLI
jgi:flagellin